MENTKRCTSCATEIQADAKKCPHCMSRQPGASTLYRSADNKMIAGVCGGIARELGMDATLVRLAIATLALISGGVVFWAYLLLWVLTPLTPGGQAPMAGISQKLSGFFSPSHPQGAPRPEQPQSTR